VAAPRARVARPRRRGRPDVSRSRRLLDLAVLAVMAAPAAGMAQAPGDSAGAWDLATGSHITWVRVAGARGAELPPVIYLHGGPGAYEVASLPAYRPLLDRWARLGFDVYLYDQVGSGRSGRLGDPTAYTVARHVADLEEIRERIGAPRIVLIGESWGASLAASYIAAHPDRVRRAVFVSPGVIDRADWERAPPTVRFDPELLAWVRSHGPAAVYRRCLELDRRMRRDVRAAYTWAGDAAWDSLLDAWATGQVLARAVAQPSRVRSARMHGMGFWSWTMTNWSQLTGTARVRPQLRRFARPVLILHGLADYLPAAIAERYAATFPRATLIQVPAAGHLIWVDRPDVFGGRIAAFLEPEGAGHAPAPRGGKDR
jgi:pimeloyl-ACP methyl ester carboxylesterase